MKSILYFYLLAGHQELEQLLVVGLLAVLLGGRQPLLWQRQQRAQLPHQLQDPRLPEQPQPDPAAGQTQVRKSDDNLILGRVI